MTSSLTCVECAHILRTFAQCHSGYSNITLCWSARLRPAHISLTIRCHRSVSVFRLASKASFLPWTRSFRLGIRRSKKGAEDTFTSCKEEKGGFSLNNDKINLQSPTENVFLLNALRSLSDLQIPVLSHLHVSRSTISQQEEPPLSHGDFSHTTARLDWRGQLENTLAGLDVLQDRGWQAHLKITKK